MKLSHRAFALTVTVVFASTLVACDNDQMTPTDVIKEYANALNRSDFDTALGLIAEPGDVTADKMAKLDGIDIPEPKAVDTDYGNDEESLSLQYDVGGEELSIGFIKEDGGWKVREPQFLTDTHTALASDEPTTSGLVEAGSKITTADGTDIMSKRYVVVAGESEEIPLSIDFPGNDYVEGMELKADGQFFKESSADNRDSPWFEVSTHFNEMPHDWVITDKFYEEIKNYALKQPPSESSDYTTSIEAFAAKDQCDLSNSITVVNADESFKFSCEGGISRRTYTKSYQSIDGPIKKGQTEDEVAKFHFRVEDGEIVDS
jgi:hypothetical protein